MRGLHVVYKVIRNYLCLIVVQMEFVSFHIL